MSRHDRPADLEALLARLERDVAVTVGASHRAFIRDAADTVSGLNRPHDTLDDRMNKIAEDVQQMLHDTFVDTTWPACPRHHRHPLEYRSRAWWCEADGVRIAALGELPPRQDDAPDAPSR